MTYFNEFGQARLGWNIGTPSGGITPSTLWNSIYSVYNADSTGSSSLKTSLYAAYNGESNTNDSYGTNNGTAIGGLTYTTGKIGNAFDLNGSNAYVSLPNNSLNLSGNFSYSAWVYFKNVPAGEAYIVSATNGNATNINYGTSFGIANGQLILGIYDNNPGTAWRVSSGVLLANTWYHVAVTKVAGVAPKFYINGVLQGTTLILGTNNATLSYSGGIYTNSLCSIGTYRYNNGASAYAYANARIDAVNVWNKELTQSEITELYNSGNGAQYITNDFYKPTTNDALNTYNGTAQGGLTYGVGKVGTAFTFNGSNAYVSIPNNSWNFTDDFSVSFWINPTFTSGVDYRIMGTNYYAGGTYGNGWQISRFSTNNVAIQMGSNSFFSQMEGPSTMLPNNTWTHVVVTRKKSTSTKIYINGTDVTSSFPYTIGNSSIDPVYAATQYCQIGANKYDANPASSFMSNGSKMDAVNVWNKILTQSEITELYNSGNGKQYPN